MKSTVLAAAGLAGVALVLVGCGGSSSPDVAHLSSGKGSANGSSEVGGSSPESGPPSQPKIVPFARCMRANGVPNFPEPVEGRILVTPQSGLDRSSAQFQAADKRCGRLLPEGGTPSPQVQRRAEEHALKFSACMRSHGEPDFPEPEFSGNAVKLAGRIDPNSPHFKAAQKACLKYFPGGPKAEPSG